MQGLETQFQPAPPDNEKVDTGGIRRGCRRGYGWNRRAVCRGAAITALALFTPSGIVAAAQQQDQELNLALTSRVDRAITVAVPVFSAVPGAEAEAGILQRVLVEDLNYSMVFEVVDPQYYPATQDGDGPPDFAAWRRSGAEALIRGFVRRSGDDVIAQYYLYDVQSGGQIIGEQESGRIPIANSNDSSPALRALAHEFNDEAVLYYTGVRGVAATSVAFVSSRRGPKEIFVMNYDGYGQQRITNDGGLSLSPAFSPKGDQIAYVSYRMHNGIPNVDIAMLNRSGGVPPVIVRSEGQDTSPAWAPDGSRLVFSSTMHGIGRANAEIYTVRPDGSDLLRITDNSEIDTSPTFSPNGREVAFISSRAGAQHLYKMSIDGTNIARLHVEGTQIDSPAWNPNPQLSDLIAYAASEGGNRFQIFVYSLTTRQSVAVTRGYGRADSPSWSPDGRQIVYEASQGDDTHIFAVGFDGSRLRQLTRDGNNQSPSWGGR
jgi:TolB protein